MRIKDANILRMKLRNEIAVLQLIGRRAQANTCKKVIREIEGMPEIEVVPLEEYEALERRFRELEKRLSDVESSPFDGGMSQAEYFNGARRAVWLFDGRMAERNFFKCSECGCTTFTKESEPNFPQCPDCGRAMNGGVSDG